MCRLCQLKDMCQRMEAKFGLCAAPSEEFGWCRGWGWRGKGGERAGGRQNSVGEVEREWAQGQTGPGKGMKPESRT